VGGIMIYYGYNRLENWYIDQLDSVTDFTRSLVAHEIADVSQTIQELMVPELRSLSAEETSSDDYDDTSTVWRMVGST
jgi:hypothetical protein